MSVRPVYKPAAAVPVSASGIVQRQCACGSPARTLAGECEDCQRKSALGIQAKLMLGSADDPMEREADHVADRMTASPNQHPTFGTPVETLQIRRKSSAATGGPVPAPVYLALGENGQALPGPRRAYFESRLGHDFSRVRIHIGASAARAAESIAAHAYTAGHHIVFGSRYSATPDSIDDKLLAHELTHVVQQGAAPRLGRPVATASTAAPLHVQRAPRAACVAHMSKIGNRPVCRRPPSPDVVGSRVHSMISKSFRAESPGNHISEVPIPYAPKSSVHSESSPVVPESVQVLGKVDLVKVLSRDSSNVRIQIGEIKPMKWTGFAQGEAEIRYYKEKIEDATDECVRYKKRFLEPLEDRLSQLPKGSERMRKTAMREAGRNLASHVFCTKLNAIGKRVTMPSQFGLAIQPRTLTLPGAKPRKVLVRTCDPGVITYRCLEKLDDDKKKKKRKNTRKNSKKAHPARKSSNKAATRQAQRVARRAERQVRRSLRKQITDKVARRLIASRVGRVAGRVALKAIPVVGWVLLAIDIAEAAYGIYNTIKYGPGSGGSSGSPGGDAEHGTAKGEPGETSSDQSGAAEESAAENAQQAGNADTPGGGTGDATHASDGEADGAGTGGDAEATGSSATGEDNDSKGATDGPQADSGPGTGSAASDGSPSKAPAAGSNASQGESDIDPELARLGIFDSPEQAEAYAASLPLSDALITALKQSSQEQQQLLELMLTHASDGRLPRVDEDFFVRMLAITKDLAPKELDALSAALVPVSSETLEQVLERYEKAIAALRAGKTPGGGKQADKPKKASADRTSEPPPDITKGTSEGQAGAGRHGEGKVEGKAKGKAEPSSQGDAASTGSDDRATAPPAGSDRTAAGVFGFYIISGMSAQSKLQKGDSVRCSVRINNLPTGQTFRLDNVSITFDSRSDEQLTFDGVKFIQTRFRLYFTSDFWSEKNKFYGRGGVESMTDYDFGRRRVKQ